MHKYTTQKQRRALVIGTFSAASNVTGVIAQVDAITALLHAYGALAFWDYAAAGPYVKIDMNPISSTTEGSTAYGRSTSPYFFCTSCHDAPAACVRVVVFSVFSSFDGVLL